MTLHKSYAITEFKTDASAPGSFTALVSVFGNVDQMGDRVMPGAFLTSIAEWKASGDPIPVIHSHDWANPHAHIGFILPENMEETDRGLVVKGQLDIEDNPFAAQVYKLMKQRRMTEFSFAYEVRKERLAPDGANNLESLGIIEIGPTLKGANSETELLGVKAELEAAARRSRKYFGGSVSGSNEERAQHIYTAVNAWVEEKYPSAPDEDRYWGCIVATFDERVVIAVEKYDEETEYFEMDYTADDDGVVTLGDPQAVEVQVVVDGAKTAYEVVGPKETAMEKEEATKETDAATKAGRVISKANEQKLRDAIVAINEVLATVQEDPSEVNSDADAGAKSEEQETAKGEETADLKANLDALMMPVVARKDN